jgi:8-oxoguanine deaminase
MSNAIWLKSPAAMLISPNADCGGGIVVRDDTIIEMVGTGEKPASEWQDEVDLANSVVLPGLINTHHHFYQTLTRCVPAAMDKALFPWLQTLYPIWKMLDREMLAAATELAALELVLSGATTVADHHYVFPVGLEDAIDIQAEAVRDVGCRAVLTRGSMSLGESLGGLPPDSIVQSADVILRDSERVINAFHDPDPGSMLQIALAPCSPFSVSAELMRETAALAKSKDVLLHTHLAETEEENRFCLEKYGLRPLDYLDECNWLHDKTWLAHGIHFNASEIDRLGKAGVGIAHCPTSNMILGSGICPSIDLINAGCRFGLAVDGSASNDGSNMIQEARQALLQQRLRYGPEKITAKDVLTWATTGSASLLRRDDIGAIRTGMQADLAIFDLDELRFSGAGDPLAALIMCGAHRVSRLMVAGKWIVEDATHCRYLDQELIARHSELARKLQTT